jgi:superfamily I DNA/RNA helicase/Zn-dependent peptidase ImmA (M78 family)
VDGFDAIRDKAQRLHDLVVGKGTDPLDPLALVCAAAKHLGFDLVWLDASDPALKGARALFDEQSGVILCEAAADPEDRALLVAHEIGHAQIHGNSTCCDASDIDATRSTEAAPVGLQRVEDYGAHERRELQANVFAREFVLPRSRAAELHQQATLSSQDIAGRTKLPLALIRQQLFDALLLPPPASADVKPPQPALQPEPSQERAAGHRGKPFLLQAGPGTGKTRTLVSRVSSLIADGVDPASILVLTFSNRAAGELAERLTLAEPESAPRIWIGTFHAFGLDLVRRYHDRLQLPPDPTLFDRSDAIEVMEEILPTLPLVHYRNLWDPAMVLRDVIGAISRAKDEMTDAARYRALAQAMFTAATNDEDRTAAKKCLEVARIYDLYEDAIRKRGAVDFGDLIMLPTALLESDDTLRLSVQLRHRHLLVDEYQDVNRASARLLKAVAGDGNRLWVVGDARQSIYRFRGASSANMVRFGEDYPGGQVDKLDVNYRSTEQIVSTYVSLAPQLGASRGMLPLALTAERGMGPAKPQIRRFDTPDDEVSGIAASICDLEAEGVPLRKQAVLCRSNARLNEIAAGLEARGIPVLHLGSLFERDEVRDMLALLSLAIDPFGDALVRVATMPRYDVSLQDVSAASQHLRAMRQPALLGLPILSEAEGLSAPGIEAFKRLAEDLGGLQRNASAWDFLSTYLLDRTDLARQLAAGASVTKHVRAVAIWQFLNFVRDQGPTAKGLPIQRTLDRVRQLVLLAEDRDLRQVPAPALHLEAVKLMTVHGSKGLEFEAVHLPGLTVQSFPANRQGQRCPPPAGMVEGAEGMSVADEAKLAHENEEQCLFFVALSRARTYLRLYLARKQPGGGNRSPSPFLEWLPPRLVDDVVSPAMTPLPADAPRPRPIQVTQPESWKITDSRLVSYDKCPRRFFYTHVLGLGAARKRTAFTQAHDCLHDVIRWLAAARLTGEPTLEQTHAAFEAIWQERGPLDHAFHDDYRLLADRLVRALFAAGKDRRFREAESLILSLPNGDVIVEPSEIAELPDGTVAVRKVRTGRQRSNESDQLEYSLYHLASRAKFGPNAIVQAIHLTDDVCENVSITATKVENRRKNSDNILAGIDEGWFPTKVDAVTCPRCPHFFICAATPRGALVLTGKS